MDTKNNLHQFSDFFENFSDTNVRNYYFISCPKHNQKQKNKKNTIIIIKGSSGPHKSCLQ